MAGSISLRARVFLKYNCGDSYFKSMMKNSFLFILYIFSLNCVSISAIVSYEFKILTNKLEEVIEVSSNKNNNIRNIYDFELNILRCMTKNYTQ